MSAIPHLQKQLQELTVAPPAGFRVETPNDLYEWVVWFCGPPDSAYEGGQYKSVLTFPKDFPMKPPSFRIISSFWHPNVYPNGDFCISILHAPGEDDLNAEESAMMRWTPVRTISSVLISIMSLLNDPDPQDSGAPANVEALVMFRKQPDMFKAKCKELALKSLTQLPPDFIPPTMEEVHEHPVTGWGTGASGVVGFHLDNEEEEDDDDDYVPAPPLQRDNNYLDELQQLRDMEFAPGMSDEQLLALLAKHRGEVASVIIELSE